MRNLSLGSWSLLVLLLSGQALCAQSVSDPPAEQSSSATGVAAPTTNGALGAESPAHAELVAMREAIVTATNTTNVDGLLEHVHPDVVVVWQNAVISRGHAGIRDYYQQALGGPDAVLESYTVEPRVQELTIMHGDDMGIAYGKVLCHFKFKDGRQFDLEGPWSATMVRNEGAWQIASFHASSGLFDNPWLLAAKSWLIKGCVASLVVGVALGAAVMGLFRRQRRVA